MPLRNKSYFQKWNCVASFPIPTFMYLLTIYCIYSQDRSAYECITAYLQINRTKINVLNINVLQINGSLDQQKFFTQQSFTSLTAVLFSSINLATWSTRFSSRGSCVVDLFASWLADDPPVTSWLVGLGSWMLISWCSSSKPLLKQYGSEKIYVLTLPFIST